MPSAMPMAASPAREMIIGKAMRNNARTVKLCGRCARIDT
jgi:hypothetical protein